MLAVLPDASIDRPDGAAVPAARRASSLGGARGPRRHVPTRRSPVRRDRGRGRRPGRGAAPTARGWSRRSRCAASEGGWTVDHALRNGSGAADDARAVGDHPAPAGRADGRAVVDATPPGRRPTARSCSGRTRIPATRASDLDGRHGRRRRRRTGPPAEDRGRARPRPCVVRGGTARCSRSTSTSSAGAPYADRGAAIQVFLSDGFCELETLGPLREVAPGDVATHRERWIVRSDEDER